MTIKLANYNIEPHKKSHGMGYSDWLEQLQNCLSLNFGIILTGDIAEYISYYNDNMAYYDAAQLIIDKR